MAFCHTIVRASTVVPAPLEEVWGIVRVFGTVCTWIAPVGFNNLNSELLPGHIEGQVGCRRIITLDNKSYVQELTALNDEEHIQRYKLVDHPGLIALNPFPHALVDYSSCLHCKAVTLEDSTFFEWEGEFDTDPHGVVEMQRAVQSQMESGMRCLCRYFSRMNEQSSNPASTSTSGGRSGPMIGSTSSTLPPSTWSGGPFQRGVNEQYHEPAYDQHSDQSHDQGNGQLYHQGSGRQYDQGGRQPFDSGSEQRYDHRRGRPGGKSTPDLYTSTGSYASSEEMPAIMKSMGLNSASGRRPDKAPSDPYSMKPDAGGSPRYSSRDSQNTTAQHYFGNRPS